MPKAERGQYPVHLPKELCDRLAVRVDTLPKYIWFRGRGFLNFFEGAISEISETVLNWGAHPETVGEDLSWEESCRRFAPDLAFFRECSELLLAGPRREELDAGFCGAAERYLATPSPRSEQERLDCVVKNRSKSCPRWLESFLLILPRGDLRVETDEGVITQRDVISQRGVLALKVMWLCAPEVKEILEESYVLEMQLVKDCMAAIDLEQEAFVSRVRELLRAYAAVRVERKRYLSW